jgi:deoxyribodipyrimidine photolyase-like uncharacterized protein
MKKKLPFGFGQERPNDLFKRRHQSIFEFCHAHHIQRLMITGNFALWLEYIQTK